MQIFDSTAGTVTGTHHVRAGRNNQDAWSLLAGPDRVIAVVADGCGGSPESEVGARIGVRLVTATLSDLLPGPSSTLPGDPAEAERLLETLRQRVLQKMGDIARIMGGNLPETVARFFLFTVVGLAVDREHLITFSCGDGHLFLNGRHLPLGPFPGNQPPYLGYGLLESSSGSSLPHSSLIHHHLERTADVQSLLIATDGLEHLLRAEHAKIPGHVREVGPASQFWSEDAWFQNPDALRRKLFLCTQTTAKPLWDLRQVKREDGLLADDTTIIALRRRQDQVKRHNGDATATETPVEEQVSGIPACGDFPRGSERAPDRVPDHQ